MTTSLNIYRDYFDTSTREGIALYNAAVNNFKCPNEEKLSLHPKDATKFVDTVSALAIQYAYDFLIEHLPTTRTVTPGVNVGDPQTITYGDHINIIETYASNNVERARKLASLTWGDESFTVQNPSLIRELTQADGDLTNHVPPRLTVRGKNEMRDRMHEKMLGHHLMAILDEDAIRALKLCKNEYTWKSIDGRTTEVSGVTMLAICMSRLKPHYKVDMFSEIKKAKELKLSDFKFNVSAFCDAMKTIKLKIDEKDPSAYTDDAFAHDIFKQLTTAPVDSFKTEYESIETKWMMGRTVLTADSLMEDAELHYVNLSNNSKWILDHKPTEQIMALTTQLQSLQTELKSLKSAGAGTTGTTPVREKGRSNTMPEWRLKKIENGKEHNEIEENGRTYWWCNDGHFWNGEQVGMYITHKPGEGHKEWKRNKDERRGQRSKTLTTPAKQTYSDATKPAESATKKKLSLSQKLQAALCTQTGISEDHFQKVWDEACDQSGN